MLTELRIRDLGIITEIDLVLGPGMTALTGETGAGKTMLVEAIGLLLGATADATVVRHGAEAASVEGRFVDGDTELVLARVVPADGRSRAYVDGRLATAATLAEAGARLVDLHGQRAHESLLAAATQRDALDRFAGIDLGAAARGPGPRGRHRRPAGRPRRRRPGPGPRDRPAALPGRRAGAGRPRRSRRGRRASTPRRTCWPTPRPTARPPCVAHDALAGDGGDGTTRRRRRPGRGPGRRRPGGRRSRTSRSACGRSPPRWPTWPARCGRWARPWPTTRPAWPRCASAASSCASCAASTATRWPT